VGDTVTRKDAAMSGVVTKITPTRHGLLMSDGASRAWVRVRWSNGYESQPIPEAHLRRAPAGPRHADVWREQTGSAYGPYYIVDTRRGKVVSRPFHDVGDADREMKGYDPRTHQVIDQRYLTDLAFGGPAEEPRPFGDRRSRHGDHVIEESWEEKTRGWREQEARRQGRERELRGAAGHVERPRGDKRVRIHAHGKVAVLNALPGGRDFFLKIEGESHGRFGTWPQITADVGHFRQHGVLPRAATSGFQR